MINRPATITSSRCGDRRFANHWPNSTPIKLVATRAKAAPKNTTIGDRDSAVIKRVANWVLSPISAKKIVTNVETKTAEKPLWKRRALVADGGVETWSRCLITVIEGDPQMSCYIVSWSVFPLYKIEIAKHFPAFLAIKTGNMIAATVDGKLMKFTRWHPIAGFKIVWGNAAKWWALFIDAASAGFFLIMNTPAICPNETVIMFQFAGREISFQFGTLCGVKITTGTAAAHTWPSCHRFPCLTRSIMLRQTHNWKRDVNLQCLPLPRQSEWEDWAAWKWQGQRRP